MPDEALQAACDIKAACDDISRKLLRWHWEEKPGAHRVDALMKHLAQAAEQQGQRITAEELAEWAGTIGYEVLLSITRRVHRIWLRA